MELSTVGWPSDWVRSGHFVNHRLYTDCKASSATVATPVVQTGFYMKKTSSRLRKNTAMTLKHFLHY